MKRITSEKFIGSAADKAKWKTLTAFFHNLCPNQCDRNHKVGNYVPTRGMVLTPCAWRGHPLAPDAAVAILTKVQQ